MNCKEFEGSGTSGRFTGPDAPATENERRLVAGLRALSAHLRPIEAPARVERRLLAAYRSQAEFRGMRPRAAWLAIGAWAAALTATAGLALFLVAGRQPERTHRMKRSLTQLAAVEMPADLPAMAAADGLPDDFIALPNAAELSPTDAVNVVRVEMPRSAMIALGFTVQDDRISEPVEADIVLGPDGLARAVRFLE